MPTNEPVHVYTCVGCKKKFPEDKFVVSWNRCEGCYDKTVTTLMNQTFVPVKDSSVVEDENDI